MSTIALKTTTIDAIGIDVGYFQTKYSYGVQDGQVLVDHFPSVAAWISDNTAVPGSNNVVKVAVDGKHFFVGPDAPNLSNGLEAPAVTDDYSRTDGYKALFRGALSYIARNLNVQSGELRIRHLVVGLPVRSFNANARPLKSWMPFPHMVPTATGKEICVVIDHCTPIYQPQGALLNVFAGEEDLDEDKQPTRAVLDMGGGTFDWFITRGLNPQFQRCGSAEIGMNACALKVAEILGLQPHDEILNKVSRALGQGSQSLKTGGREYDLSMGWSAVSHLMESALNQMVKGMKTTSDLDQIVITGGGGKFLHRTLQTHAQYKDLASIATIDADSVKSNCRGFHQFASKIAAANA